MRNSDKNSQVMKRIAIRHQIRRRYKQANMWNKGVDETLRSFDLKALRHIRKVLNAY